MKDHITQCISSGIMCVLANWEDQHAEVYDILDDVNDFVACVSDFVALDDWNVSLRDGTTHTVDVTFRVCGEEELDPRKLTFTISEGSLGS